MRKSIKVIAIGFVLSLFLTGCSMWNNGESEASPSPSLKPSSQDMTTNDSTVSDYLAYMQKQNMALSNITPVEITDFNALEGSTFNYNNQMFYLYRFDMQDEKIKALLDNTTKTGVIRVMINGAETDMPAMVNKNYALIYGEDIEIDGIKEIFSTYDFMKQQETSNE